MRAEPLKSSVHVRIGLSAVLLVASIYLFGCSGMPSGEERNREALRQYEADKKSEEFARSLPPPR